MAVAKDGSGSLDFSSYLIQRQAILGVNHSSYGEKGDHGIGFVNNYSSSASPCSSSSSACTSNNGLGLLQYYKPDIEEEGEGGGEEEEEETHDQYSHQLINFQTGPLLNFQQRETEYSVWEGNNNLGDNNGNHNQWFYSEAYVADSAIVSESSSPHKRPHAGAEDMPNVKRHCTGNGGATVRKPKPKANSPKDPQSVAAKNRRERISERLKILQDLIPNGSKVDLVTMLEKAISYVKFLQLQVKVLATDEFWPVQGGKAPDISQVKEAIDAILSSQRDRNPTSK